MRRLSLSRAEVDRGAIAIMVALLVPILLAAAALAVDMSASFAKHSQLQNGADAAALALAQQYAASDTGCVNDVTLANEFVRGSVNRDKLEATGDPDCLTDGSGVTVVASALEHHYFLPLFGRESSPIQASATVEWGRPVAGSGFPLTFSECAISDDDIGQLIELWVPKDENIEYPGCASSDYPPGGFGFLKTTEDCESQYVDVTDASAEMDGVPGNSANKVECDWETQIGKKVFIPIFYDKIDDGKNYYVKKFAAFELLGVDFSQTGRVGFYGTGEGSRCKSMPTWAGTPAHPYFHKHCVFGKFVDYVSIDDAFEIGPIGPGDDTLVVRLTD